DKIDEVVDLSNEELKTNLYLLEDEKGFFFPEDWEVSYTLASEDFFAYFMPNMLLFSAKKETCEVMSDVLDDFSLKYVGPRKTLHFKEDEGQDSYLQLKITLERSSPKIWRRFIVKNNISFHELHNIIQIVMGWENYHMYRFIIGKICIEGEGESGFCVDSMWSDFHSSGSIPFCSKNLSVKDFLTDEIKECEYIYDFGDQWHHTLIVEKISSEADDTPIVLDGKRSCPPEDCGGMFGYEELLEIKKDKTHELYEERIVEWLGEDFDSEYFDKQSINRQLNTVGFWKEDALDSTSCSDVKMRKLGRNEPCYCGSGKKYKKCCLSKDMEVMGRPRKIEV
ncbi:MAG: SEC-C metal-binding domain-containing protein, partial [Candidatus Thermoplasmatota archaeon]|nr:SEC-C metal-binding domain-containing protein [Candidatus Thermoplasmatota archaeon]